MIRTTNAAIVAPLAMRTEQLAKLVDRKHQVLTHLRTLALRQLELVGEDDWAQLTKVLATKEQLLALLMQTEAELNPFRTDDPEARVWRSAADRDACRRLSEECVALLAEVTRLERLSEGEMVRRRDEAADRLSGMHAADAARHAYGFDGGAMSVGLDLVSEG